MPALTTRLHIKEFLKFRWFKKVCENPGRPWPPLPPLADAHVLSVHSLGLGLELGNSLDQREPTRAHT